ncbi:hypothetical protein RUM43_000241 [Polyplax serrata]|uniref:Uncharacterized protein n=1 Tax=Polyplax serrata TaxID=468196 RepID=A0AAN8XQ25_POLSC
MGESGIGRICFDSPLKNTNIRYPTQGNLSLKNLERSLLQNVDKFQEKCVDPWKTDVRETHVRNRRLLDLPFTSAPCCTKIYNVIGDRQKLKKLKKFGLSRPVRGIESDLESEIAEKCFIPREFDELEGEEEEEEEEEQVEATAHEVKECYTVADSDSSEEEDNFILEACRSGSLSSCSACSTLGEVKRRKTHVTPKLGWQDLLHGSQVEYCKNVITKELTRYKGSINAELKLQKYVLR